MYDFSNFGSLKSTETELNEPGGFGFEHDFSNFGSLKSTETRRLRGMRGAFRTFQQFRLVEEH